MKLLNKLKIAFLITFFIIILYNLKVFAVTGVITEITVNMRKEPSTNSKKIMYVTQDYKVDVLEKVGEWYKIKYNGVTGYVFGEYVDVDDSKLEQNKESITTITQQEEIDKKDEDNKNQNIQDVTTDTELELQINKGTQIRLIPNIVSSAIYTSKKISSIDVVEQIGVWSYIYVDKIYGWVRTDDIIEKNSLQTDTTEKDNEDSEEELNNQKTVLYIKYDIVNLRKKASTSSKILAKLKLNNEVTLIEKINSTWSKVEYDGITGYVSTDLLSLEKVKEKEEKDTTSRDGETVSRDEEKVEEKQEENTNKTDSTIEEEKTNKEEEKETTSVSDTKKEETTNTEEKKEEITTDSKDEVVEKEEKEEIFSKTKGEEIAEYAKKYLGYDYVLGGASPKKGFDCSGLTYYVYKQFGYTISRTSKSQAKNGTEVSRDKLQPGDLLIFKNQSLTAIGHVGIYIGDNKMIHASEPGIGVVITDLDARGYNYNKRYVTARRIV